MKRIALVGAIIALLLPALLSADPLNVQGTVTGVFPVGNNDNVVEFRFGSDTDVGLVYTAPASIGGAVDEGQPLTLGLGSFRLYRPDPFQPHLYLNVPFLLTIDFSAPPGAGEPIFSASLWGAVAYLPGGFLAIDFAENEKSVKYTGGSFTVAVNDLTICLPPDLPFRSDPARVTAALTGEIRAGAVNAVPEPVAFEILGCALFGALVVLRKRV